MPIVRGRATPAATAVRLARRASLLAGSALLLLAGCDDMPTTSGTDGEVAGIAGPTLAKSGTTSVSSVTPSVASIEVGGTVQLTAVDANGNPVNASWSTSSSAVATVSSSGLVTGVSAGQVTITAKTRKQSATATVTVTSPATSEPAPVTGTACTDLPHLRRVSVSTASQLSTAVKDAQPGDLILLADGTYATRLTLTRSGKADATIILCGTRGAVLDGGGVSGGTAIRVEASHWRLHGFTITNGLRGVLVHGGSHNVLSELEIHTIGQEAVHLRAFSSYNVVQHSRIYETGVVEGRYGEGVYIGTSDSDWSKVTGGKPDASDHNQVIGNVFGPNIRAENVDVKDGTSAGVIRGNRFSGAGTGEDDWVDLKGNDYRVEENQGAYLASGHGYRVRAQVSGWGRNNVLLNNTVDLQGPGYGFMVSSTASGTVVRCNNTVTNAGSGFSNTSCTP